MADFNVYIYPNDSNIDDDAVTAKDAIIDAANQLDNYGAINNWVVGIRYDHPNLNAGSDDFDDFQNWRESNYFDDGCHLWLTGDSSLGYLGKAEETDSNFHAWYYALDAVVSTSLADFEGIKKEASIQETLHNFLYLSGIDGMIDDESSGSGHEHDLGSLEYIGGNWKVTPMAAGYEGSHRKHGDCQASWSYSGHTTTLTSCTKQGIKNCNPQV